MKIATIALLVIALSVEARSSTNTLSLTEAKRLALENGWDILAAQSGVDSATAQLIITKEFPNPTASLSTARIGTHENATPEGNSLWDRNYDTIAAINQLFEIAGKRRHRQKQSEEHRCAGDHDDQQQRDRGYEKHHE